MDVSLRIRQKFKQHRLKRDDSAGVCSRSWIHKGRPSVLFRCQGHCKSGTVCSWLGWIPIEDVHLLGKATPTEKSSQAQAPASDR